MSVYSFDTKIAELVGVNAATIYHNLEFWVNKNEANNKNFKDGNYWVYNSVSAWLRLFPFMTTRSIRTALDKLITAGLVETGQYNEKGYDKTTWYAICHKRQVHLSEMTNPFVRNDKPIPVSNPVSNPVKDIDRQANHALLEKGYSIIWDEWKANKKKIGKTDTSTKAKTFDKNFKKLFNTQYFKNHTADYFKQEVSDICEFIKVAHSLTGFNKFENMQLAKFLSDKQWRD